MEKRKLTNKILTKVNEGYKITLESVVKEEKVNITDAFASIRSLIKNGAIEECGDGVFKMTDKNVEEVAVAVEKAIDNQYAGGLSDAELREKVTEIDVTLLYVLDFILSNVNATEEAIRTKYGSPITRRGIDSGKRTGLMLFNDGVITSAITKAQLEKLREWYKNYVRS